ncbi:MAG: metallophosphoesterase, partial [Mycobacterium sp.]
MFIVVLGSVLGLMHLYVWKRMVKDTTRPGRTRWLLSIALAALMVLLLVALLGPRTFGVADAGWYAWPGYFWFGLIAYLFLVLLVLEPVRLALRGWVKRAPTAPEPTTAPEPAPSVDRRIFLARAGA